MLGNVLKIRPFLGGLRRLLIAVRNVDCIKRSSLLELNTSVIETFAFTKGPPQPQRNFAIWHIPV